MKLRAHAATRPIVLLVPTVVTAFSLSACNNGSENSPTFVQAAQVQQWLADHECDRSGAVQGYPAFGGQDGGQIAQETFVCDNGKTFQIQLQNNGTYTYTQRGG
jgi:hypothetical protein